MKPDILAYQAVIFDLDGTLVDSMGMWGRIDIEYLGRFGIPVPDGLQKELEGMSFSETALYFRNRFGIRDSVEKIGQDWLDMADEKYRTAVSLKPGVSEFLSFLKEHGIRMAIASSNHYNLIADCLTAHGVFSYFNAITTCDDVSANKPDPSVYLTTAGKLKTEPSACLVFEDIPLGILAGKRAGMTVCAVEDRYSHAVRAEKEELADAMIADYRELLPGKQRWT